MSGAMVERALWCARKGFRVFPIKPGDRTPAHKGWQEEATTDEAQIRRTWNGTDYNIGVATGGGLAVIDIDIKDGKRGEETFAGLRLPDDTFVVRTPSGGRHLYFRVPQDVRNSVQALGPGVDVRGAGGYVVGPGSVIGGKAYQPIAVGAAVRDLGLDLPAARSRDPDQVLLPATLLDTPEAVDRAIAFLTSGAPLAVEGDGGDLATYKVACALKDIGLTEFMTWDLMVEHWNDRCSPPWSSEALETKVRNAFAYGTSAPGAESPAVQFRGVEIEPPPRPGRSWRYHGQETVLDEAWLFHEMLPAAGVAVIVGPTGSGKTFVQAEMARCVATLKPFFGTTPEERGSSLFLFAGTEGSGFPHRLMALQEEERLPISYTHVTGLREKGALDGLLTDLKAQQAYMLERFGAPLKVVFLETLSASGLLSNENDNAEAANAINNLAQIGRQLGVLVVTSHHPPKHGAGARGAEAIPSNSDYVLEITRHGKDRIREIELTKARNTSERKLGTFSLVEVQIGHDSKGRPVTSMALSMGDKSVQIDRDSKYAELLVECVEHALLNPDAIVLDIDGVKSVFHGDVWNVFKERSTSKSNLSRSFKLAVVKADNAGAIVQVPRDGQTFIQLPEPFL